MRYTHLLNGKAIFFLCSDTMKDTAEFFSTVLQHEDMAHNVIQDKRMLQIGWGFYKVRQTGNEYQILACDVANDPFQSATEDLSLNLEIFSKQRRILSITKAAPLETSFQDTLIVHRAAVKAPRVYLQRNEPEIRVTLAGIWEQSASRLQMIRVSMPGYIHTNYLNSARKRFL